MAARERVYKTEAVVLRRRNFGEADSIFTLFSAREGKFEAVARGVRKARSHMRGHVEPLTHARVMVAHGRNLDVLTQAETIHPFRAIREDLERTAAALYCAEIIDEISADRVSAPDVYALLLELLAALEAGAPCQVMHWFELNLLALSGYEVQLDVCASCGARLPELATVLAPAAGGLVCVACRPLAGAGRLLAVRTIKVLRFARAASLESFAALRLDGVLSHELQAALGDVIRHTLEREPRAGRHIGDVARLPAPVTAPQPNVETR